MSKKSQLAIMDAIMAISVFVLLIMSVVFIWNDYSVRLGEKININRMQIKAFQITNSLIKTAGVPTAWEVNSTNVEHIGLATKDRSLSKEKVNAFINLSYNKTREVFNINMEYDFYFRLKDLKNNTINITGLSPRNTIINLQKPVLYENKESIMEFALWK